MAKQKADQHSIHPVHLFQLQLENKRESDRMMNYFLAAYFLFGLLLAFVYDTWLVAFGVGGLSLLAYYAARYILPESNVYQYVLSVVLGLFMAQFIYQMHGMFEMHFVAFISSAVLITFQNWKLQIPLTIVVVVHHALFNYLQATGVSDIYFTTLPYMGLSTFIIHILLACIIFFICGLWAHQFKRYKMAHMEQTFQLGLLMEKERHAAEQREAQERIAQSEANLQAVFNNTDVAFMLIEKDSTIISFNENANRFSQKLVGKKIVAGSRYFDLVPPNRKDAVTAAIAQVSNIEVYQYEICYQHVQTAEDVWLHVSMHPVTNNQQQLIGISLSMSDISESKRLQEQVAIEKALKQKEITEAVFAAQEKERSELGRELHDNVNQLLAASNLYTQMAITMEEGREEMLKTSINYTQMAIDEIRKLAKRLVTPHLNQFGLMHTIRGLADDIMAVHPVRIQVSSTNFVEDELDEKFKLNLYRIVQEQINNALKYAQANTIDIRIVVDNNQLLLFTTDDGVGFDVAKRSKGIGLTNMVSRTELYKGHINFDSAPGKGCFITVRFPLAGLRKQTQESGAVAHL